MHAKRHKRQANVNKVVGDVHFVVGGWFLLNEKQVDGHHSSRTKQGVGEHVDYDVRCKPRTLQGGHQRLVVYFRFHHVDNDEHRGQDRAEREYPLVAPTQVDYQSGKGKE